LDFLEDFSFAGASSADFSGVFSVCFFAFLADFFAAFSSPPTASSSFFFDFFDDFLAV